LFRAFLRINAGVPFSGAERCERIAVVIELFISGALVVRIGEVLRTKPIPA
jgi:hypothetical protein